MPDYSLKVNVKVGQNSGVVECLPDTGAEATVMGVDFLRPLGLTTEDLQPPLEFNFANPDDTPWHVQSLAQFWLI